MKRNLIEMRDEIDKIDEEFIRLFEKRMNIVTEVANYKKENNIPILNKEREDEVITKNLNRLENIELKSYCEELLRCLMNVSKEYQKKKI